MQFRVFRDFVSARGENRIASWLRSLPVAARVDINNRILFLEQVAELKRPAVGLLRHQGQTLVELRIKSGNVQYRPIGYYGPQRGEVTLLIGTVEKGGDFEPKTALDTALERIALINAGKATTREHEIV